MKDDLKQLMASFQEEILLKYKSWNYEFKALNIPMGTHFFQLKPLIPKHGLVLKSSNYELYGDLSRRVIATLSTFTPDVEQYSIDEAFIHVTLPTGGDYFEFGRKVRQRYKKSGVMFFGLESDVNRQIDLFADTAREEKDDRLSKALDKINAKYGRGTSFHLSEGFKKPW